jgi:hypothetical protein
MSAGTSRIQEAVVFEYRPKKLQGVQHDPAIGPLAAEFECFEPNPKYAFGPKHVPPYAPLRPLPSHIARDAPKDCPPITPVKVVPARDGLSLHVQHLVKALWKGAEPTAGVTRGAVRIGNERHADQRPRLAAIRDRAANAPFRPQVAPTGADSFNEGEMALDWKAMDQIQRVSAFTFRGDRDGPNTLINVRKGFKPPATRTDRSYLEGAIYEHFASYLQRRYGRALTQKDFLAAVDQTVGGRAAQETLVAYMLWRKLVEKEQFHLGRMTVDECLKAFISTSTSLPVSMYFATGRGTGAGWMYVTLVSHGFSVPNFAVGDGNNHKWATGEHEIAKMGSIDPADIVGFRHVADLHTLDGPVYFRESFRKSESHPFARLFDILSGMPQ